MTACALPFPICCAESPPVLDSAGPLEPLQLTLAGRDAQGTFAEGVTMADQRTSVDRLAAATGAAPVFSALRADSYTYTLTADLPGGFLLVASTHPTMGNRAPADRTTSTPDTAALLRGLLPWASTLAALPVDLSGLEVRDDSQRVYVQLLVDSAGDPTAALEMASTGVRALRTCPGVPFGIDGHGASSLRPPGADQCDVTAPAGPSGAAGLRLRHRSSLRGGVPGGLPAGLFRVRPIRRRGWPWRRQRTTTPGMRRAGR
ncbi:hypothetical protein AB0D66_22020 [Streptomyces sp. NPDC048270]|uniref:hypothetical protein n=1 Tax=Streptomyces sp. NPDC048270 TaxID=3154615 RepID=UPI0034014B96